MSTFFLDYEGGNDAADGTTFANRWKTFTLGATAARIAPNDTIRVMGSPAPTSLGIYGTWTDGPYPATTSITSSTNATPIVITKVAHGLVTGDTVNIIGHTTNTFANGTYEVTMIDADTFSLQGSVGNGVGGATGTFRKVNNNRVVLASILTKNIVKCDLQTGTWTASASVTATTDITDYKDGYGSASIAIAAGFATGLAAYRALSGGATDYSAYKQVTFWIKQTAGTIGAAGACTLTLCSDALGVTAVDTLSIPSPVVIGRWFPVTVDKGSALGASIQSVGFNVVTDNGAQTFLLDCITACKDSTGADAITLQSLIGKNTGTETFCAIAAIQGTRVMLDQGQNALPSAVDNRGYSGTTETVTAYKRETIKSPMAATTLANFQTIVDTGTLAGGYIYFEGGYDRTAMTTQNLETWFDGLNGLGQCLVPSSTHNYVSLNKISAVRYNRPFQWNASYSWIINNMHANNNSLAGGIGAIHVAASAGFTGTNLWVCYNSGTTGNYPFLLQGNTGACSHAFTNIVCDGNATAPISLGLGSSSITHVLLKNVTSRNNGQWGVYFNGANDCVIQGLTSTGNASYGVNFIGQDNIIYDLVTSGNGTAGILHGGKNYLVNASIAESTEVVVTTLGAYTFSQTHDTTANNTQIFTFGGRLSKQATVRHTASGFAWQIAPTSTNIFDAHPLYLPLATIMCAASTLVTVKAWFRRDNTGVSARLVCKGGQIAGVASDVTSSMTVAADTWEQLTITFTPSAQGAVDITAEAFGGTTFNVYIDDETITQA